MILRRATPILVQGITGREASFWTERMLEYGARVVAGVSPGKAGRSVSGVPVYGAVADAARDHRIDATVLFVPPLAVKGAALEAIRAGVRHLVVLTEHVPVHDVMALLAEAGDAGARVVGPNCPGLVTPGETFVGIMPAWAGHIFRSGEVGVVSRSGSLGTLICLNLVREGFGQSAFVGIGGDAVNGTSHRDVLEVFEADPRTKAVVLVGEVGGTMEEEAAEYVPAMTKPVVALIAGQAAPPGRRMGHAGAIVSGGRGSAASKMAALARAGARVVDVPSRVGQALRASGLRPQRAAS
jgi:succinyl-CoA synthetase alpha subunit